MQFMVTIAVCPETRTKHVNGFRRQNARPSLYSEQLSFAVTLYFPPPVMPSSCNDMTRTILPSGPESFKYVQ
jgi:hypothetical protein